MPLPPRPRPGYAATASLRGRPRGRFRATTMPSTKYWPPQTPHGLGAGDRPGQARLDHRARPAQGLGELHSVRGVGEPQVRVVALARDIPVQSRGTGTVVEQLGELHGGGHLPGGALGVRGRLGCAGVGAEWGRAEMSWGGHGSLRVVGGQDEGRGSRWGSAAWTSMPVTRSSSGPSRRIGGKTPRCRAGAGRSDGHLGSHVNGVTAAGRGHREGGLGGDRDVRAHRSLLRRGVASLPGADAPRVWHQGRPCPCPAPPIYPDPCPNDSSVCRAPPVTPPGPSTARGRSTPGDVPLRGSVHSRSPSTPRATARRHCAASVRCWGVHRDRVLAGEDGADLVAIHREFALSHAGNRHSSAVGRRGSARRSRSASRR